MFDVESCTISEYINSNYWRGLIGDEQEESKFLRMMESIMPSSTRLYEEEWALYVNAFRLGRVSGHKLAFMEKHPPTKEEKEWLHVAVPHMLRIDKMTTLDALRISYLKHLGETKTYDSLPEHQQDQVDGTIEGILSIRSGTWT